MTRLDSGRTIKVQIQDLVVWTDNPRINTVYQEKEAISLIYSVVGESKMINMMKDIYEVGLQSNERIIVVNKEEKYHVYDGNRRIAAIKTLLDPMLVSNDKTREKIITFKSTLDSFPNTDVEVTEVSEEVALKLILRKHGNNSDGTGLIPWSTWQRDKTLNKLNKTPEYLSAYNAVIDLGHTSANEVKNKYKIEYTDLERILSNEKVSEYFKSLKSTNDIEKYRIILEKFLLKISYIKYSENKPISRIFARSKEIIDVLETFKQEFENFEGDIDYFMPNSSKNPTLHFQNDIIKSLVKQGKTVKNSVYTDDLLIYEYQNCGIDIGIPSNSVFVELGRIRRSDLAKFQISFGSLIRILIFTSVSDFLKAIDESSKDIPNGVNRINQILEDDDFIKVEKMTIKNIREFILTNVIKKKANKEDEFEAGPFLTKLHDIVHNGTASINEIKNEINNYIIPFVIAMSNHLYRKNSKAQ